MSTAAHEAAFSFHEDISMKTSATGIALIQAFESCLKPTGDGHVRTYHCPAGVVTIGWGTTAADVPDLKDGDVWTKEKCDTVFAASLPKYEAIVDRSLTGRTQPITQPQFDALVSLAYNCGPRAFAGSVGAALREGRDRDVPACLARWNKADGRVAAGLVRRRKAEGQLFAGDLAAASKTAETILPGSIGRSREVPVPTTAELARATPKTTATIVAAAGGTATAGSTGTSEATGIPTGVVVGLGLAVALVAGLVLARRWKALKEDWA
jgi:lysozyme